VIGQHNCPFAVKSGGHALSAGASNADGGITIDLKLLNRIDVLDEETTRVGTGNKWATVYEYLEPLGKSVVGGRNGAVGVGGFILGGNYLALFPSRVFPFLLQFLTGD
jgi:FAD/FMN-containing dehydrogenase